jgi:hypothetical protein
MAGLAGFKSGEAGVKLAMKNNGQYIANLKQGLQGVPRTVLATLAAASLEMAVKNTKHDSSRFAANWDLGFSSQGPALRTKPAPLHYGETTESAGTIGKRKESGAHRKSVLAAKATYYGYSSGANGIPNVHPEGRLASWIGMVANRTAGMAPPRTIPRVELYNPFTGGGRKDGGPAHDGNSYAYNALKGGGKSALLAGAADVSQKIGNALIPMEILRIRKMLIEGQRR